MAGMSSIVEESSNIDRFPAVDPSNPKSDQLDPERSYPGHGMTRRTSIFTVYAKVFRVMLARWGQVLNSDEEDRRIKELDDLILPSDEEWRQQVYYRLVDLQRENDAEAGTKEMESGVEKQPKELSVWEWEPSAGGYPLRPKGGERETTSGSLAAITGAGGSMTEACIEPGWRVNDLVLAVKVLEKKHPPPVYADESEMRRVFGLVYDVLRYKHILNHALEDVDFWYYHPECKVHERIVWLLLYDMQGRKFARRGEVAEVAVREKLFQAAGLKGIEDALLETKTRLAASVSRLRISGSALTLEELLPPHLRTADGVVWGEEGAVASGWVNTMKIPSKDDFVSEMAKLGLQLCENCEVVELDEKTYMFDPLCPKVVNINDGAREKLAKSDLVRNHRFIFLERSLCLGAAALAQAVRVGHLCGPVVLTHAVAPRHTGYLAGLLADIDDAGRLLAFGTGELRRDYEAYLHNLGVTLQQCRVFSEKYVSPPPSAELERATIVLASPPCSYTGVRDAVDLAVARGGDTGLLETLTTVDSGHKQPQALLTEQLTTLKHALTRPNVQLLLYEAHSVLPTETTEMVEQVVQYANRMAAEKYIREHPPKKRAAPKEVGTKSARSSRSGKRGQQEQLKAQVEDRRAGSNYDDEDEASTMSSVETKIPDSDLFELGRINEICGEASDKFLDKGCYLALLRRKEMMQFNSLFMIKVAEMKGLFGDSNKRSQPKEERSLSPVRQTSQTSRKSFKRAKVQMDRIAAHTHSSMVRTLKQNQVCPRHNQHVAQDERMVVTQTGPVTTLPSSLPPTRSHQTGSSGRQGLSQETEEEMELLQSRPARLKSQVQQEESVRRLSLPTLASVSRTVNRKDPTLFNLTDDAKKTTDSSLVSVLTNATPDYLAVKRRLQEIDGLEPDVMRTSQRELIGTNSGQLSVSFQSYASSPLSRFVAEIGPSNPLDATVNVSPNVWRALSSGSSTISGSVPRNSPENQFTRRTDSTRMFEKMDNENWFRLRRARAALQKVSRLHHPGGPPRFARPGPGRTSLETVDEHTLGFPYLFSGTGNAMRESGFDNS